MHLNRGWRWRLWWQHLWFLLLFMATLGLLAWLSQRYAWQADWTASGRHTLTAHSQRLLATLHQPIRITAYLQAHSPQRAALTRLLQRYQRYRPEITLEFINPDLVPQLVRARGIHADGMLDVEYGTRSALLEDASEASITQTLLRLSREPRLLLFLDGHGERKPQGIANHDLGSWGRELAKSAITAQALTLTNPLPAHAALVIASPQTAPSASEMQMLLDYVQRGGNLLWLLEPGDAPAWAALAAVLGIRILPGTVVDTQRPQQLQQQHPSVLLVADYAPHPISVALRSPTLFPQAAALLAEPLATWRTSVLLESAASSWNELGALAATAQRDVDGEVAGSLALALALTRPHPSGDGEQRVVVIGDGDFLSNTYLGNGANLQLGLNSVYWLLQDELALTTAPLTTFDPTLQLSARALAWLALGFLILLPLSLVSCGWLLWLYRRKRS